MSTPDAAAPEAPPPDVALTPDVAITPDVAVIPDAAPIDIAADLPPAPAGTYVALDTQYGDDTHAGTMAAPVKTIAKGIELAKELVRTGQGPQTVFVAQGHYDEKVTLVEGVSLLGGHACGAGSCTWERDPARFASAIHPSDDEGTLAPAGVTRKTKVQGFTLAGNEAAPTAELGSAALTLAGGTPTLTGNTFTGAKVTAGTGRSVAIMVQAAPAGGDPGGALIDGNTITGGDATKDSIGVAFQAKAGTAGGAVSVATLTNNTIRGGAAPGSYGVLATTSGAGTLLKSNQISGGASTGNSWGIVVHSTMVVDANRINAATATAGACTQTDTWCGGILSSSAAVTIVNNIVMGAKGPRSVALLIAEAERPAEACIVNGNTLDGAGSGASPSVSAAVALRIGACASCNLTGFVGRLGNNIMLGGANQTRYGVFEESSDGKAIHPERFEYNDLYFAPAANRTDVLYRLWKGSAPAVDLVALDDLGAVPVKSGNSSKNISADPLLDASMHLSKTPPSPCIDRGTTDEAPPKDFEGQERPAGAGVDIGHDEAQ